MESKGVTFGSVQFTKEKVHELAADARAKAGSRALSEREDVKERRAEQLAQRKKAAVAAAAEEKEAARSEWKAEEKGGSGGGGGGGEGKGDGDAAGGGSSPLTAPTMNAMLHFSALEPQGSGDASSSEDEDHVMSAYELFEIREVEERKRLEEEAEAEAAAELARVHALNEYCRDEATRRREADLASRGFGHETDVREAIRTAILRVVHQHRYPYPVPEAAFRREVRAATPHTDPSDEQLEDVVRIMLDARALKRSAAHTRGDERIYVGRLYARQDFDFGVWEASLKWPQEHAEVAKDVSAAAAAAAAGAAAHAAQFVAAAQKTIEWVEGAKERARLAEEAERQRAVAEALRLKLEAEQAERNAAKREWDELAHLYEEGTPSEVALHDAELYLTEYHALDEHDKLGKPLDRCLPSELGMDFYKTMKSWGASNKETVGILRAVYYFGNCHVEKPGWAMKGDAGAIGSALEHLEEEMADVLKKARHRFFSRQELAEMAVAEGNLGAQLNKIRADIAYVGKTKYAVPKAGVKEGLQEQLATQLVVLRDICACDPSD
jgi:hypothetical protein